MQKMWPESNELLNRMESFQIDAVPDDTSNGQVGKSLACNYSVYFAKDKIVYKASNLTIKGKRLNYSASQKEL